MNTEFWYGKKVFLTGHTGFKGSWLSLWLQKMGANVVGYALEPPSFPSLFEVANVADDMESIIGDIRDHDAVKSAITKHEPEVLIHMAAQALVRYSYEHPVETYATNVMGTVNILDAVRLTPSVKAVLVITSDKCYENREWVWGYRENEAMGGYDPYSNSKGCAELVTTAYRQSFFNHEGSHVAVASARAGNVIGGGDWADDRLIPDMIRAICAGKTVYIRNPHAIRPWQHVLEPLSGYLQLAEKLFQEGNKWAEGWNFGPNDQDAKPVQWIVEHFAHLWGGVQWEVDPATHPHEARYLKLDCSKARMQLGWEPVWSLEDALKYISLWYKGYLLGENMRENTCQQILEYERGQSK